MYNALIGFERLDGTVTMNYLGSHGGILHAGNILLHNYYNFDDVQKLIEANEHEGCGISSFNKDYEPSYYDDGDELVIQYKNKKDAINEFAEGDEIDNFYLFCEKDEHWYVYSKAEKTLVDLYYAYIRL